MDPYASPCERRLSCARLIVLLLIICTVYSFGKFGVPAAAGQTESSAPDARSGGKPITPFVAGWVIPPGQEEVLAGMLGRGASLPGPCNLAGAEVDHNIIKSTYNCPQGEVVFELRHPSEAPNGASQTAQFGVVLRSGTPPDGFIDALVALIRSKEGAFQWKRMEPPAPVQSGTGSGSRRVPILVAGVVAIVVLGWILRRRRSAPAA